MFGGAQYRFGAGDGRIRILEVGRRVSGSAGFAVVAILVLGATLRALALDEAVGQEKLFDRVVILFDGARFNQTGGAQFEVNIVGAVARLVGVGRVIVVKPDMKAGKVAGVFAMDAGDQLFRRDPFFLGTQHDRRAVCVVRTNVPAFITDHLLVSHPDVGLDIFNQMAKVNGAIGIGQGGGDENFARHEGPGC